MLIAMQLTNPVAFMKTLISDPVITQNLLESFIMTICNKSSHLSIIGQ